MDTQRNIRVMYIAGGITVLILLVGMWAWQRGVIFTDGGKPHISLAAFNNPRPSLDRAIHYPESFDENTKTLFDQKLEKAKTALRENPNDVSAWFDLAIYYRMVNDQAGAVEIWKYVSTKYPTEGISLHNLGEYYFHTAKDYPTAEQYYMRSIAIAPQLGQNYLDLFDMYKYVYKQETIAAPDILKQGASKVSISEGTGYFRMLGLYYQEKGDTANARTYYKQALAGAQSMRDSAQVKQIQLLISTLK